MLRVSTYSNLDKVKRISAGILRFVNNLKVKDGKFSSNYLPPDQLIKVEEILIQANQVSFSILNHPKKNYTEKYFEILIFEMFY